VENLIHEVISYCKKQEQFCSKCEFHIRNLGYTSFKGNCYFEQDPQFWKIEEIIKAMVRSKSHD